MEGDLQRVGAVSDLAPGNMRRVFANDGRAIAIYNVDGEIFATDNACTHGASSLSEEGYLEGHIIECGFHAGAFDIRTGEVIQEPCVVPLRTYRVVVVDEAIYIDVTREGLSATD